MPYSEKKKSTRTAYQRLATQKTKKQKTSVNAFGASGLVSGKFFHKLGTALEAS